MHAQSCCFAFSKLIAFLPFSLPSSSLRKFPILKVDNYNNVKWKIATQAWSTTPHMTLPKNNFHWSREINRNCARGVSLDCKITKWKELFSTLKWLVLFSFKTFLSLRIFFTFTDFWNSLLILEVLSSGKFILEFFIYDVYLSEHFFCQHFNPRASISPLRLNFNPSRPNGKVDKEGNLVLLCRTNKCILQMTLCPIKYKWSYNEKSRHFFFYQKKNFLLFSYDVRRIQLSMKK